MPPIEAHVLEEDVPTCTFASLLEEHGDRGRVDLLYIDAEGYDWELLRGFPFIAGPGASAANPSVVVFEHKNLYMKDRLAAAELLQSHGYTVADGWQSDRGEDMVAWLSAGCHYAATCL